MNLQSGFCWPRSHLVSIDRLALWSLLARQIHKMTRSPNYSQCCNHPPIPCRLKNPLKIVHAMQCGSQEIQKIKAPKKKREKSVEKENQIWRKDWGRSFPGHHSGIHREARLRNAITRDDDVVSTCRSRWFCNRMIDANVAAVSSRSRSRPDLYDSPMVQAERRVLIDDSTSSAGVGRIVLATLFATLGPLSFGFCLGYSSSALEDFQNSTDHGIRMNDSEGSLFSVSTGGWFTESVIKSCDLPERCTKRAMPSLLSWVLRNESLWFLATHKTQNFRGI